MIQKYWDIVNKYYSPKKQEILKKLEIIKKKGFNKLEEDINKILENDKKITIWRIKLIILKK